MGNITIDNIKEFHTKMVEVYRPAYGTSEFFDYRDDIDNSVYFSTAVGEVRDAMLGYLFADDVSRSIITESIERLVESIPADDVTLSQLYAMRAVGLMLQEPQEGIAESVHCALSLNEDNTLARLIAMCVMFTGDSDYSRTLSTIEGGARETWRNNDLDVEGYLNF